MSKLSRALQAQLTDAHEMLLIARVETGELYAALERAGEAIATSQRLHDEASQTITDLAAFTRTMAKRIEALEQTNRQAGE